MSNIFKIIGISVATVIIAFIAYTGWLAWLGYQPFYVKYHIDGVTEQEYPTFSMKFSEQDNTIEIVYSGKNMTESEKVVADYFNLEMPIELTLYDSDRKLLYTGNSSTPIVEVGKPVKMRWVITNADWNKYVFIKEAFVEGTFNFQLPTILSNDITSCNEIISNIGHEHITQMKKVNEQWGFSYEHQ